MKKRVWNVSSRVQAELSALFRKYDADSSGAIDKARLSRLPRRRPPSRSATSSFCMCRRRPPSSVAAASVSASLPPTGRARSAPLPPHHRAAHCATTPHRALVRANESSDAGGARGALRGQRPCVGSGRRLARRAARACGRGRRRSDRPGRGIIARSVKHRHTASHNTAQYHTTSHPAKQSKRGRPRDTIARSAIQRHTTSHSVAQRRQRD